uniref:Serine/arginine-rich splicing factor 2 n=1 Tax=Prolemur simus TaxID=1328070 RepID=A0A8C8YMP8_PROSS
MSYSRPPPNVEGMTSVKVDNLTYRASPDILRRLFEKYGSVGDVYIPRDYFTKESRGFAFVRFHYKQHAEKARNALDGTLMHGHPGSDLDPDPGSVLDPDLHRPPDPDRPEDPNPSPPRCPDIAHQPVPALGPEASHQDTRGDVSPDYDLRVLPGVLKREEGYIIRLVIHQQATRELGAKGGGCPWNKPLAKE